MRLLKIEGRPSIVQGTNTGFMHLVCPEGLPVRMEEMHPGMMPACMSRNPVLLTCMISDPPMRAEMGGGIESGQDRGVPDSASLSSALVANRGVVSVVASGPSGMDLNRSALHLPERQRPVRRAASEAPGAAPVARQPRSAASARRPIWMENPSWLYLPHLADCSDHDQAPADEHPGEQLEGEEPVTAADVPGRPQLDAAAVASQRSTRKRARPPRPRSTSRPGPSAPRARGASQPACARARRLRPHVHESLRDQLPGTSHAQEERLQQVEGSRHCGEASMPCAPLAILVDAATGSPTYPSHRTSDRCQSPRPPALHAVHASGGRTLSAAAAAIRGPAIGPGCASGSAARAASQPSVPPHLARYFADLEDCKARKRDRGDAVIPAVSPAERLAALRRRVCLRQGALASPAASETASGAPARSPPHAVRRARSPPSLS